MDLKKIEAERLRRHGPAVFEVNESPRYFDLVDDENFRFESPVTGRIEARALGASVQIRGLLRTVVSVECVRCLEPLRAAIESELSITFMNDDRLRASKEPEDIGEGDLVWYDGEVVEPMDILRQYLMLEVPGFPACELDEGDVCPIYNVKRSRSLTFGGSSAAAEEPAKGKPAPAEPAAPPSANTWQAQMEALRRNLDSGAAPTKRRRHKA